MKINVLNHIIISTVLKNQLAIPPKYIRRLLALGPSYLNIPTLRPYNGHLNLIFTMQWL